jgi:hypothetical protein
MNLQTVMPHTTLRQMSAAQKIWVAHVGPDGATFQQALAAGDFDAVAAIVAAKTGVTLDEALDAEIDDTGEDDTPGGSTGGTTGTQPQLSPVNGH